MTDILHPEMMTRLADFFPSTATIQYPVETRDPLSGEISVVWTDLPGHVGLGCANGPSGGVEVAQPDQTYVVANFTVALQGVYPSITEKMRAVIDGVPYEILLVQHGSHGTKTRMLTRLVT